MTGAVERALSRHAVEGRALLGDPVEPARTPGAEPRRNLAAPCHRGDVIRNGKLPVVVVRVEWRGESWAVMFRKLVDRGRKISVTPTPATTFLQPEYQATVLGRWEGDLAPGSPGTLVEPSAEQGATVPASNPKAPSGARPARKGKENHTMATVTRSKKGTKPAAKSAAKKAPASRASKFNPSEAEVKKIAKRLRDGEKMNDIKATYGLSNGQPVRKALLDAGFDSKGNENPDGLSAREARARAAAAAAKNKPAKKPAAKKQAAKPAAKPSATKAKVTRRARKADPS